MERYHVQFSVLEQSWGKVFPNTHLEGQRAYGALPQPEYSDKIPVVCCLGSSCQVRKRNDEISGKKWAEAIDQVQYLMFIAKFLKRILYRNGCNF